MSRQLLDFQRFLTGRNHVPWRDTASNLVVVASGKGGVGTSTVTLLMGLAAAHLGRKTLLIDTNELSGSLHRMAGVEAAHSLEAVARGAVSLGDAVIPVAPHLSVLAGGAAVHGGSPPMTAADRRTLMVRFAPLFREHACVIVDAGATLSRVLAATSRPVQQLLLVSGHDAIARAASFAMVKAVDGAARGIPVRVVFNRADAQPAAAAFAHLASAVHRFLRRPIALAGFIADEPSLAASPSLAELAESGIVGTVEPLLRTVLAPSHESAALRPVAINA